MATLAPPREHSTTDILAAGGVYLDHLEHVMQRKRTTIQDYRIMLDRHLGPFFGATPIGAIAPHKVADFIATKRRDGLAPNTVKNQLNSLHALFKFAVRREWAPRNPVDFVDRPPSPSSDPDIRFLDREELEALLRAAGDDLLAPTDRALWLTAATTGLRQGELAALRWRDVDWNARVVRVRRSFSRGQYTTPKSRRSVRAVPMPDRVAAALARHFSQSTYQHDDELVFGHPHSGRPYDASNMRERFKAALARAGLRPLRFHDLRHTYGTLMAAAGAPLRTLQGWMGHRDYKTTAVDADFAPDPSQGAAWAERAFGSSSLDLDRVTPNDPRTTKAARWAARSHVIGREPANL
ncbi:integrase [Solirubrobacter pauli]|uniref:Integrase n=1 Tax=Solirubrobacter pauli TaxID=166793 RepID=A0A660LBZ3_9ACTN|nr:site-specific integrase [Solirubrobacter pauli]RKQ91916.1 integrase [Solirubrobacter pauli]